MCLKSSRKESTQIPGIKQFAKGEEKAIMKSGNTVRKDWALLLFW